MAQVDLATQLPGVVTGAISDLEFQQPVGASFLGTLLFDDITFPAGSFFSLENVQIDYQEIKLQSVRYTIQQSKNIVRTAVSGRDGTVKEYNNSSDFSIRGTAELTGVLPVFPRDT